MKILFMGSDKIACPLLELLQKKAQQLWIVSQPDRPSGRGQKLTPSEISAWALEKNVPLLRPEKLDAAFLQQLKEFSPDIIFVMAYGRILKNDVLQLPRLGCWNLHASLLPQLRGASPIETAIAQGDEKTGVALMKMALGLDEGPVADVVELPIGLAATSAQLRSEVAAISAQLVEKNWSALATHSCKLTSQDPVGATYCRTLGKDDAWLDPQQPAEVLLRRIRAFAENIGSVIQLGEERLKIFSAQPADWRGAPGKVLSSTGKLIFACGTGAVEVLTLQRTGGKRLPVREFLQGFPIGVGALVEGRPHRPLVDKKPFPRNF